MKKNIVAAFVLVFALASCNSQLDDINTNPNATEHPLPAYLLTGTLKQGADLYWGADNNFNSSLLFVQQCRITSYNVCYTKLLRFCKGSKKSNSGRVR